jgi:peptidoglycan L-alanyl-D-glutamate endopeptidase CwlK
MITNEKLNLNESIKKMKKNMGLLTEACSMCNKRTSENISTLDTTLQMIAQQFIDKVYKELGKTLTITNSFRSKEEQDRLYCQGRPGDPYCIEKKLPTGGKIVTKLKGGKSKHNFGMAFDVYFSDPKTGRVDLNTPITPEVAKIGKELGLVWGGDWQSFKDYPHFELPQLGSSENPQ